MTQVSNLTLLGSIMRSGGKFWLVLNNQSFDPLPTYGAAKEQVKRNMPQKDLIFRGDEDKTLIFTPAYVATAPVPIPGTTSGWRADKAIVDKYGNVLQVDPYAGNYGLYQSDSGLAPSYNGNSFGGKGGLSFQSGEYMNAPSGLAAVFGVAAAVEEYSISWVSTIPRSSEDRTLFSAYEAADPTNIVSVSPWTSIRPANGLSMSRDQGAASESFQSDTNAFETGTHAWLVSYSEGQVLFARDGVSVGIVIPSVPPGSSALDTFKLGIDPALSAGFKGVIGEFSVSNKYVTLSQALPWFTYTSSYYGTPAPR